ncbi:MAG: universal stress protein [Bacteroidota bacterium]|nr:universal stress protein [Bacteroidota bacterium]
MVDFKKIMVCIDFTEIDEALIKYTEKLLGSFQIDSIVFLHIIQRKQSNFFGQSDDDNRKSVGAIKNELNNYLSNLTKGFTQKWLIDIFEGDINDKIFEATKKYDIDLLVMGRKHDLDDSEGLPKRTVKKSGCSVLLVPEAPVKEIKNLLVPIDFSEYAAFAVKVALALAGPAAKVHCQHVYEVPSGYHRSGKDYYEFAKVMAKHAENDTATFIKKYNLPKEKLDFTNTLDENNTTAKIIITFAKKNGIDFICMGSKGRTGAASIFMGSVADDIVSLNDIFPLLVVKKKNENLGLFDAISRL